MEGLYRVTTRVIIKVTIGLVDVWEKGQEESFCILRLSSYGSRNSDGFMKGAGSLEPLELTCVSTCHLLSQ